MKNRQFYPSTLGRGLEKAVRPGAGWKMSSAPLHKVLLDSCGNEVHCKSQDALDRFNKGLLEYVRSHGNCMGSFEEALKLDNEFVLVNCVLVSFWFCLITCLSLTALKDLANYYISISKGF